jgi:hypothetical protein
MATSNQNGATMRYAFIIATLSIAVTAAGQSQQPKTPIRGLVSMGAYKFVSEGGQPINTLQWVSEKPGAFGGIVIVVTWGALQAKTPDIAQWTVLDHALNEVRAYNDEHRDKPLAVKLRVWAGFEAPPWAMRLDGQEPVTITPSTGKARTIGHAWSPAYRNAWREFQKLLADRYDSDALIHEVSVTSCMTFTAEPFFIPHDAQAVKQLRAAGFTNERYRACLEEAVADYDGWKTTRVEFPFNPFSETDAEGNIKLDYEFTKKVMHACRDRIGDRCTLDNHDLNVPSLLAIAPIYDEMRSMGGAIEFQTFCETPDFYAATVAYGAGLGAGSIELWQDFGGFRSISTSVLKNWSSFFQPAAVQCTKPGQ